MKKLIALFALVILMGQGCASDTAKQPRQTDTAPQEANEEMEPNIDEQPVEKMDEPPIEGIKGQPDTQPQESNNTNTADEAAIQTVDMKSGNFFFEPANITAEAGQKIEVTFTENTGFHTFVIDEIDLNAQIEEGETITFTAPEEPGSYAFYCDVGNHRAAGMEGVLTVE
jgi:plastocyanin